MVTTSRYWNICVISPPMYEKSRVRGGYKDVKLNLAEEFFKVQFPDLAVLENLPSEDERYVQRILWQIFYHGETIRERALAGLCLRCYISQNILIACRKIAAYKPGNERPFTYVDLLPFVLNDDGKTLIVLDRDGKNQIMLGANGESRLLEKEGRFFSVEIIRTYNPELSKSQKLDNWVMRRTPQCLELKKYLWSFGYRTPSDWALLCRDIPKTLEPLLEVSDRKIVEVFHAVYRRDRLNSGKQGLSSEPTTKQLQEMIHLLGRQDLVFSTQILIYNLRRIADILRQDKLSKETGSPRTESTEIPEYSGNNFMLNPSNYIPNPNLPPSYSNDPEKMEYQDLQNLCSDLAIEVLSQAIAQKIEQKKLSLAKRKKYAYFAEKFPEGLRLYYQEKNPRNLGEIAKLWGIEWHKARRIFNLRELLTDIQYLSEEIFMNKIIQQQIDSRLQLVSQDPDYLKEVAEAIRGFIYDLAFEEAFSEIFTPKNQSRNSLFAQLLRQYLDNSRY
ncbi:hypothetical protein [Mastigocoleus testarum]|nr:hypothetical protein [Mastigocoleus testarum]